MRKKIVKILAWCIGLCIGLAIVYQLVVVVGACVKFTYQYGPHTIAMRNSLTNSGKIGKWSETLEENLDLSGVDYYGSMNDHYLIVTDSGDSSKYSVAMLQFVPEGYKVGTILSADRARTAFMELARIVYDVEYPIEQVEVGWDEENKVWMVNRRPPASSEDGLVFYHTCDMIFTADGNILLMAYFK